MTENNSEIKNSEVDSKNVIKNRESLYRLIIRFANLQITINIFAFFLACRTTCTLHLCAYLI